MQTVTEFTKLSPEIAAKARIGIITSQFNSEMTHSLEAHCVRVLVEHGVAESQIERFAVPGALEIPVTASLLASTGKYDALVALGVVLKGDTYHFELVADETARGCMQVALQYQVPVINEVLAAYTPEQAVARTGDNEHNKGREAAGAVIAMLQTVHSIKG